MPDSKLFTIKRSTLCVFPQVLQEYELHSLPDLGEHPLIIDAGANVGAFTWFALQRWPGAKAICFEPHPETASMLTANMDGLPVEVEVKALVHPKTAETAKLFEGKNADTECSLRNDVRWPHVSQVLEHSTDVPLADAADLPPCDVFKVDTEGNEVPILTGYKHLANVEVLLVEAHAVGGDLAEQMRQIVQLAINAGLQPVDIRGTTIRFVRDMGAMKVQPPSMARPGAASPSPAPDGDWAVFETFGGQYRFGKIVDTADNRFTLEPSYHMGPSKMIVPAPHPGGGIAAVVLDMPEPFVWGDGGRETVWATSMKPLSRELAGTYLALQKKQASA